MDESTRQATRLWTLAQPKVSAFVTSVVRDFRDRDDLVQDIAVAVVESFDTYDPEKPFVPWSMGIARNQVGLYLRRRRRDRQVFDPATIECLQAAFTALPETESVQLAFLQECMQRLDGRGRQLCELRYRQGLKPAAISESLGMAGTAVRKALQRIRERLRRCIEKKAAASGA